MSVFLLKLLIITTWAGICYAPPVLRKNLPVDDGFLNARNDLAQGQLQQNLPAGGFGVNPVQQNVNALNNPAGGPAALPQQVDFAGGNVAGIQRQLPQDVGNFLPPVNNGKLNLAEQQQNQGIKMDNVRANLDLAQDTLQRIQKLQQLDSLKGFQQTGFQQNAGVPNIQQQGNLGLQAGQQQAGYPVAQQQTNLGVPVAQQPGGLVQGVQQQANVGLPVAQQQGGFLAPQQQGELPVAQQPGGFPVAQQQGGFPVAQQQGGLPAVQQQGHIGAPVVQQDNFGGLQQGVQDANPPIVPLGFNVDQPVKAQDTFFQNAAQNDGNQQGAPGQVNPVANMPVLQPNQLPQQQGGEQAENMQMAAPGDFGKEDAQVGGDVMQLQPAPPGQSNLGNVQNENQMQQPGRFPNVVLNEAGDQQIRGPMNYDKNGPLGDLLPNRAEQPRLEVPNVKQSLKIDDLQPPDHLEGVRMEQDGHLNRDYRKEIFLGHGHETFEQISEEDAKKKLRDIFSLADGDEDGYISELELEDWIIQKIKEHFDQAAEENENVFSTLDSDEDGYITWEEFQLQFMVAKGLSEEVAKELGSDMEKLPLNRKDKDLLVHYRFHWSDADTVPQDNKLDMEEFKTFRHPEASKHTSNRMVKDILDNLDRNGDSVITEDEFAALPPGEVVEEEWREMDRVWVEERRQEFRAQIDLDKDGQVDAKELEKYVDPQNPNLAKSEAKNLVQMADINKDNKLSLAEVLENKDLFLGSKMVDTARNFHDEF